MVCGVFLFLIGIAIVGTRYNQSNIHMNAYTMCMVWIIGVYRTTKESNQGTTTAICTRTTVYLFNETCCELRLPLHLVCLQMLQLLMNVV